MNSSATGLRTILHDRHVSLGARMVDFGGWDMPVQYDGILAEHQRTRQHVSMFDTCHMDEFLVDGPGSLDFLSRMVTQNLRTLADGRCRYGFLLRDDGGVLDDLIVYRMAVDNWMVVVNAGTSPNDFKWMKSHLPKTGATLKDMRGTYGKLDVQGPESRAAMEKVLGYSLGEMGYFTFKNIVLDGALAVISRTGYTGEHGYEIYAPEADIAKLWDKLLESGVRPAGLGARDTLRLEAGLPLYGHELNETLSPVEAGMMRYAVKEEDFVGRAALLARQASGPARKLVGFTITGRQSARNGNRVLDMSGAEAGVVTSGSFAPSLGQAIGYAYVRPDFSAVGATFKIEVGSRQLDATVVTPPFYRKK
jgi:aminomethyltransferase